MSERHRDDQDRFQGVPEWTVELRLGVNPVDAFTGKPLRKSATVSIEDVKTSPELNPSGYWLYLDPYVEFPPDPVAVEIETDPTYADRTVPVTVGPMDPPAIRPEIYPSVRYAFPSGQTLVTGKVVDGAGDPVGDATVTVEDTTLRTRTAKDGTFALVVEGIAADGAAEPGDVLRVDPDDPPPRPVSVHAGGAPATPSITASHDDHSTTTVSQEILEGERTPMDSPIEI